jgi:hypothetical protein
MFAYDSPPYQYFFYYTTLPAYGAFSKNPNLYKCGGYCDTIELHLNMANIGAFGCGECRTEG